MRDAALLLTAISGYDSRDPFSIAQRVPDYIGACDKPIKGMRIAWSPTFGYAQPDGEVVAICTDAVKALEAEGCSVELVDNVMEHDPLYMWMAEFYAGVGTKLRPVLDSQPELLDPAVAEALSDALNQTMEGYYAKVFSRYDLREAARAFFEDYDLLLSPTLPVTAFDVGLDVPPQLPDATILSWVKYTYPFNLTGYPAASVPVGFTKDGLPVGLQVVAPPLQECRIFAVAAALETIQPWADKKPTF